MDALGPPADPPGSFFRPLLISLSIVAGISLSIITYHVILVKYCVGRQRRIAISLSAAPMQTSENMGLGVEEHVLKEIPVVVFSSNITKLAQNECVICLGDLEEGDKVRSLPNCEHLFHVPCIDDWLSAHTNCPICRAPIVATATTDGILEVSRREPTAQNSEQGDDQDGAGTNDNGSSSNYHDNASSSSSSASVVFRHSLSLVLPMEEKPQSLRVLRRSLSMDQWSVIIDIKGDEIDENASATSSASSSSSSSSLKGFLSDYRSYYKGRSMKQIDPVSSRLLRSFSQMRIAQSSSPYRNLPC